MQKSGHQIETRVAAGACVLTTVLVVVPPVVAEEWNVRRQPRLKSELDGAPPLKIERLGTAVAGVDVCRPVLVPNPDGKTYDVLIWYRKAYRKKTRVYVADLGTGEVKKQAFVEEEGKVRIEQGFTWWGVLARNGRLYGANPDWSRHSTGGAMNVYEYDPGANRVRLFKVIPGVGGERNPMALSPNGWVYGAGTYLRRGPDCKHKASAFGFDPETGEVTDYGAVGPRIDGTGYGYSMGVCDTHIYVACGQIPWYLVAVNIKTGEQKVLLGAPEGAYHQRMFVSARYPGAEAWVQKADSAPRKYYWLYHGEAIPKRRPDEGPPWPRQASLGKRAAPEPEIHAGQLCPDDGGRATLWWRPQVAPPSGADRSPNGSEGSWKPVHIDGVEKHPLSIHRLVTLSDGRLFGTAQGSKGRFIFDPRTGKITPLGDGGTSAYAFVNYKDELYWSGYPSAQIFVYDLGKPWTLDKGVPPGYRPPDVTNPRRVGGSYDAFKKTRVKKMLSGVLAADGKVYFGGKGKRDYHGGGMSWLDPRTGEIDGTWKPFSAYPICWLTTALGGRYVVISTRNSRVFVYDVVSGRIVREVVPVPEAKKAGPLVEVARGRLLGTTEDPDVKGGGVLYGLDVGRGDVLFRKKVPQALRFPWAEGIAQWDYKKGPDGFVWTILGDVLVRIDPNDAHVHVLGRLDKPGKFAFVAGDLYLAGTEHVRRIRILHGG